MKVGDLVRVRDCDGCYEEGEDTPCYWPESKDQVGIVLDIHFSSRSPIVKIMVLEETAEFEAAALEVINESR